MIKAKKSLGQNFLVDGRVVSRIIESVSPQPSDIIIEIGPGTGALTFPLAGLAGQVIAIETDPRLAETLKQDTRVESLSILEADALDVNWDSVIDDAMNSWRARASSLPPCPRVRVVANLPYYISTPILQALIAHQRRIFDMTLMLQDEVVDRIAARPGGKQYGYLSVLVQFYCEVRKLFEVAPSSFKPAPKVRSAVLRLLIRDHPVALVNNEGEFFAMVRAAFSQRRKTILNNLKAAQRGPGLTGTMEQALIAAGIDPRRRAETLTIEEFARLYASIHCDI